MSLVTSLAFGTRRYSSPKRKKKVPYCAEYTPVYLEGLTASTGRRRTAPLATPTVAEPPLFLDLVADQYRKNTGRAMKTFAFFASPAMLCNSNNNNDSYYLYMKLLLSLNQQRFHWNGTALLPLYEHISHLPYGLWEAETWIGGGSKLPQVVQLVGNLSCKLLQSHGQ